MTSDNTAAASPINETFPRPARRTPHTPGTPPSHGRDDTGAPNAAGLRVHWASGVVENEGKTARGKMYQNPTSNTKNAQPNTSAQRVPALLSQRQPIPSNRPKAQTYRTPSQAGSSSAQRRDQTRPNPRTQKTIRPVKYLESQANTPLKRVRTVEYPARVPDAPQRRDPPPAPRPARLLTPDLPDIDVQMYFCPEECHQSHGHLPSEDGEMKVYMKMNSQRKRIVDRP